MSGELYVHVPRKRTKFTEKQVEELIELFNKNPYPNSRVRNEVASRMNIHPRIVQVWFKNHRAKIKRENGKLDPSLEAQPPPSPTEEDDTHTPPGPASATPPRCPPDGHPWGPNSKNQLNSCPSSKVSSEDHRTARLLRCQHSIYNLFSIWVSDMPSYTFRSSAASSHVRSQENRRGPPCPSQARRSNSAVEAQGLGRGAHCPEPNVSSPGLASTDSSNGPRTWAPGPPCESSLESSPPGHCGSHL